MGPPTYCYSTCGERYEGPFDSREEALLEGRELFPEHTIWTARIVAPLPRVLCALTGEDVVETLREAAWNEVGDFSDDWLAYCSNETKEALGEELRAVVERWLKRNGHEPSWFAVDDVEEHLE